MTGPSRTVIYFPLSSFLYSTSFHLNKPHLTRVGIIARTRPLAHVSLQIAIINVQDDSVMWNILTLVRNQQMVYDICIKELARQVSVQCRERGELLNKVCGAYGALFSKLPSYFAAAEASMQSARQRIAELQADLAEERAKIPMSVLSSPPSNTFHNEIPPHIGHSLTCMCTGLRSLKTPKTVAR